IRGVELPHFSRMLEPVPTLDVSRRRPARERAPRALATCRREFLDTARGGGSNRRPDPTPCRRYLLIRGAGRSPRVLVAAISEPDEMRVRVDKAGQDGSAPSMDLKRIARDPRSVQARLRAGVHDHSVARHQCRVTDDTWSITAQRIARAQCTDAVDDDRAHASCALCARVARPLQNLRNVAAIRRNVIALTSAVASTSQKSAATTCE